MTACSSRNVFLSKGVQAAQAWNLMCFLHFKNIYIFFSLSKKKHKRPDPKSKQSGTLLLFITETDCCSITPVVFTAEQAWFKFEINKKKKKSVVKGPMVTMIRHNTHSPLHSALSGCLLTSLFAEGCKIAWEGVSKLLTGSVYIHRWQSAVYCP